MIYNNKKETISGDIITNHYPVLGFTPDVTIYETQSITLTPNAADLDGDALTYTISSPVGDDGFWQASYDDSGNYTVNITVSDGLLAANTSFLLSVLDVIPPSAFFGNITFENGTKPNNLMLEAFINGTFVASTAVVDGAYILEVAADDNDTPHREGGRHQETIVLYADGNPVDKNLTWESGKNESA
ncbi:hypothetical protein HYU13_03195, partial [Candidatus Woesearchaeota archaeon]|nr:hypothetical protein [Candidatus Woesearchaeota archaeon]